MSRGRRLRVLVSEEHDFRAWSDAHARGETANRLPYGVDRLEAHDIAVHHLNTLSPIRRRTAHKMEYRVGFPLVEGIRLARAGSSMDAILAFFEDQVVALAALKQRGLYRGRIVVVTCWLAQRAISYPPRMIESYVRAMSVVDEVVCLSPNQPAILNRRLGIPASKMHVVNFGADDSYYLPPADLTARDTHVLAAGADGGRDWNTFLAAVRISPQWKFKVIAPIEAFEGLHVPSNLELLGRVPHAEYRSHLQRAAVVVVPTHPLLYPTGQSVLIEAMLTGAPVVATDGPALRHYLPDQAGIRVPASDVSALAGAVDALMSNSHLRRRLSTAAENLARSSFTTNAMNDTLAAIIRSTVER